VFRRFFRRAKQQVKLDSLRNGAVVEWIITLPDETRLERYLEQLPEDIRSDVESSARNLFAAADAFLDAEARRGDIDLGVFYPAMEKHLSRRFTWMNAAAFGRLRGYTGWYCWHEGYCGAR